MVGYVTINNGWVSEINVGVAGYSGQIPVDSPDMIQKLIHSAPIMFWDGKQFCQVKNPKDIWKRIRLNNIHGMFAINEHQKLVDSLDDSFQDVPAGTVMETPSPLGKAFKPSFECEIKPGLKVGLSSEEDIDLWESQMVKSGLYTADEAWKSASLWFSDHMVWPIKTTWKDKIIQLELYVLNRGSNNVTAGFNDHIDRVRPLWFWKQIALPTFKCLYGYGFENITSQVRIDKPNYVKFLTEAYGHEVLRTDDKYFYMRLNIKDAIKSTGDWPARKTMGANWKWEKDGILVREATEADFPALKKAMETSWGKSTRKALAFTMLDDRWNLDMAAILVALVNNEIVDGVTFRERQEPTISSFTSLFRKEESKKVFNTTFEGFKEWQRGVGYKEMSFMLETALHESNPKFEENVKSRGWKTYSKDRGITEWRLTL
jgi:hypothetical protein